MIKWIINLFKKQHAISDAVLTKDSIQVFGNGIKIVTIKRTTFYAESKRKMREKIMLIVKQHIQKSVLKHKKKIKFKFI